MEGARQRPYHRCVHLRSKEEKNSGKWRVLSFLFWFLAGVLFFLFLFWFRCICEQPAARRRSGRWQGRAGGAGRERGGGAGRHRISRFPPPSPVHVGAKKSWFLARTPEAARGHPTPKGRGGRCAGRRRAAPEGPRPAQMDFPGSAAIPAQYPAPTPKKLIFLPTKCCFSKYRKAELLPFRPSGPAHRDRRGDPLGD